MRKRLLDRLKGLQEPTSAAAVFVLLWTYFDRAGLTRVENALRQERRHPLDLEPLDGRKCLQSNVLKRRLEELRDLLGNDTGFDVQALKWIQCLDRALARMRRQGLPPYLPGVDGQAYTLRRRVNPIADEIARAMADETTHPYVDPRLCAVTWAAHQSGCLALYAPRMVPVPIKPVGGRSLRILEARDWARGSTRTRLQAATVDREISVLLWPFHDSVQDVPVTQPTQGRAKFVRLNSLGNEDEVIAEARRAVRAARRLKATLLVLPELTATDRVEEAIRRTLARHGRQGHPILTLLGRCHREHPEDGCVNEAVLLGPDGSLVETHRKLTAVTAHPTTVPFAEPITCGNVITIFESAIGGLVPLICLDLLHAPIREVLKRSHGTVVAVPSLSPDTKPHRDAATDLHVAHLASTFVCNRWGPELPGPTREVRSFVRVPAPNLDRLVQVSRRSQAVFFSLRRALDLIRQTSDK